jgi:hypothetical protein
MGMHLKDGVPDCCCATEAFWSFDHFQKGLFNLLSLPSILTRATKDVKLIHRDAALIGDKELSLALWTLSSFVATLSGAIGHVGAQVSLQDNFMIGTEPRVDEPRNETHWDLVERRSSLSLEALQGSLFDTRDKICIPRP